MPRRRVFGETGAEATCGDEADDGVNTTVKVLTVVMIDMVSAAQRLSGPTRIDTAIATSQASFADGSADAVVLARADVFADALSGTALAVRAQRPAAAHPDRHGAGVRTGRDRSGDA